MGYYPVADLLCFQLPTCYVSYSSSIKTFGIALFQVWCFSDCLAHPSFAAHRTASCCGVCGQYAHFSVESPILALLLATELQSTHFCAVEMAGFSCPGAERNENKCWVFGMLSQLRLALMSILNK